MKYFGISLIMFAFSAVVFVVKIPGSVISNTGQGLGLFCANNLKSSAYFWGNITKLAWA